MVNLEENNVTGYEYYEDPLFLAQSEQPTSTLVTVLFDGNDFLGWRRDVHMSLVSKNKDCFIDGTLLKPPTNDKKHKQWVRCDFMVRSWILNSLVKSIKDNLKYANSARELWSELLERYGQANVLELYQLQKELESVKQDNMSLVDYYGKMKSLWESLDGLDPLPSCSCGKVDLCTCSMVKKIIEREKVAKLIRFLMGLNNGYGTICSQILSLDPLPTINKALSMLQKVERQKEITDAVNSISEINASFRVPDTRKGADKTDKASKFCDHCNKSGHTKDSCFMLHKCHHCNKFGHNPNFCYVVKGYPADKKSKGKNSGNSNGSGQSSGQYKGAAHNVELDSPLDDQVLKTAAHISINEGPAAPVTSDMLDGIITSVVDQVLSRISSNHQDSQQNTGLSSSQFAGPFK